MKFHLQMKSLKEFHLKNRKKKFDLIELLVVFSPRQNICKSCPSSVNNYDLECHFLVSKLFA